MSLGSIWTSKRWRYVSGKGGGGRLTLNTDEVLSIFVFLSPNTQYYAQLGIQLIYLFIVSDKGMFILLSSICPIFEILKSVKIITTATCPNWAHNLKGVWFRIFWSCLSPWNKFFFFKYHSQIPNSTVGP